MKNPINFNRRVDVPYGLGWIDFSSIADMQKVVSDAITAKCDAIYLGRKNFQLKNYLNNTGTDWIQLTLTECHNRGMKLGILIEPTQDDNSNVLSDSQITESIKTAWLEVFRQIIIKYPDIDAIELEEPMFYGSTPADGGYARRLNMNDYFSRMKSIVSQYHSNLLFSFNTPRMGNLQGSGIDTAYVRDNDIFDFYAPQNAYPLLGDINTTDSYIWYIQYVKNFFGNMPTVHWTYTRRLPAGPESIYNPDFFNEVKYMSTNRIAHGVFSNVDFDALATASGWATDTTPGSDCKSKLGNINITSCLSPSFNYVISEI